jgi:hypothetical protein
MPITCPACNKAGQTDAACQRCGCELTHLHEIVAAAATRLARAHAALTNRDWSGALADAEGSWDLLHTAESARLAWSRRPPSVIPRVRCVGVRTPPRSLNRTLDLL